MKREELTRKVSEELRHIPRSIIRGSSQNMLRACYNGIRRHDLSLNPASPAKASLPKATEVVSKNDPDFSPVYDRDFFQI